MNVVIDTRSGETGDIALWMARFTERWQRGKASIDGFMDLLGADIKLIAPGLRPTQGRAAGRAAFQKTFDVLPDLTAEVLRWSASGDMLFIEMTFTATIGGKRIDWHNIDRFLFKDGLAVERIAFYNPAKVQRAFLSGPKGWMQLVRRLRSGL